MLAGHGYFIQEWAESLMETVFYCCVIVVTYVFVGYPLLLQVITGIRDSADTMVSDASQPALSIVIAAHNEEKNIARRLDNLFAQEYPADKLQIVVGSDGSHDGTALVLAEYQAKAAQLGITFDFFEFAERGGKPKVLNHAISLCQHEIIVFTDARQTFSDTAVACLAARFSDACVGAVNGELFLRTADVEMEDGADSSAGSGASMGWYWRYEKQIRKAEAKLHSTVGATGAIYAIRKSLYEPIPDKTLIDDVVIPMQICLQGYRVVFEEQARAYDVPPTSSHQEWVRKVRTLAGNWQLFAIRPAFFHPLRNPIFLQFISHKVLRLAAPFCLIGALISSFYLDNKMLFVLQVVFYVLGLLTLIFDKLKANRLASLVSFFCILNCAIIVGLYQLVFGKEGSLWKFAYKAD